MSVQWNQLLMTTTPQYLRQVQVNIIRNRKVLALMESKNRIVLNCNGTKTDWRVEYKMPPLVGFADGDVADFDPADKFKNPNLEWRALIMTDAMSEMTRLENKGDAAIINIYENIISGMARAIRDQFGDEVYKDGSLAANSRNLHGIESCLGTAGSPNKLTNGFVEPNDTYATLSTKPGYYGGNHTGTGVTAGATAWPVGTNDAHYDFYSPVLVNYTDPTAGVYSAGTKAWPNTCEEAMNRLCTKSKRSSSKEGMLDLLLLNEELFQQYKDVNRGRQQLMVTPGGPGTLWSLGFTDGLMFDGTNLSSEYGVPATTGYGFNTMEMELRCLQSQLFVPNGPNFNETTRYWNFDITFYGNFRFNPKFLGKLYPWG